MSSSNTAPFPFCDLPPEVRNRIYRILLCDSLSPTPIRDPTKPLVKAQRCVETAILRTCKSLYREAYDVMIKSNRFVKMKVALPKAQALFRADNLPVVTEHEELAERFLGYVLEVDLPCNDPLLPTFLKPKTLMILHSDLEEYCEVLMAGDLDGPGFCENVEVAITIAPTLTNASSPMRSSPPGDYFTERTQLSLLAPFRKQFRGCKNVTIHGHISEGLSKAICDEMKLDQWLDQEAVLFGIRTAREQVSALFQQDKDEEGLNLCEKAVYHMKKIHSSSSWRKLVTAGGESFVSEIAETFFFLLLDSAEISILAKLKQVSDIWKTSSDGVDDRILANQNETDSTYSKLTRAEGALEQAGIALMEDYWNDGYTYQPPPKHEAKLWYRNALVLRMQDYPDSEAGMEALAFITRALEIQPDDPELLKELALIDEWIYERTQHYL